MSDAQFIQPDDFYSGFEFLHYKVLEKIGVGGQGVIWSALDRENNRIVAIKINDITEFDQKQIDEYLLENEAVGLVKLRHPRILPIYDMGVKGSVTYLVSPYIPGGSLLEKMNEPLQVDKILRYAYDIASALEYLHIHGIVHRDLKPSNVLIDLNENIYVMDFGLARLITPTTRQLHTGRGTPPYSPPEQHTLSQITLQSDIFSFGVMLYELFTRQLPWDGEKALGMTQLYTNDEIPDPREIDPSLPKSLVAVLRRLTNVTPAARPSSIIESVDLVFEAFNLPVSAHSKHEALFNPGRDAAEILRDRIKRPVTSSELPIISLTDLALVDLEIENAGKGFAKDDLAYFMAVHSIFFDYKSDHWWGQVAKPEERMSIAIELLDSGYEAVASHAIRHLYKDPELPALFDPLPAKTKTTLLKTAVGAPDADFRGQILETLEKLTPRSSKWKDKSENPLYDDGLAILAMDDSLQGDQAAYLLGHIRSEEGTLTVFREAQKDRVIPVLMIIQEAAGNLPRALPLSLRLKISTELLQERVIAHPWALVAAYGWSFLGAALSVGLQSFLLFRLPIFADSQRITASFERAAFAGALIGLIILLIRLIVEWFPSVHPLSRTLLATIVGGIALNISFFVYNVLMLRSTPTGYLLTLSCLALALGYAAASLAPSRIVKSIIAFIVILPTQIGSLLVSFSLAMTPLFIYDVADPNWPLWRIIVVMVFTSASLAILPNIHSLKLRDAK